MPNPPPTVRLGQDHAGQDLPILEAEGNLGLLSTVPQLPVVAIGVGAKRHRQDPLLQSQDDAAHLALVLLVHGSARIEGVDQRTGVVIHGCPPQDVDTPWGVWARSMRVDSHRYTLDTPQNFIQKIYLILAFSQKILFKNYSPIGIFMSFHTFF